MDSTLPLEILLGLANRQRLRQRNHRRPPAPPDLFRRVITVSLETMRIVNGLPKLDIGE